MGKRKKVSINDAGGNKIINPADFERKKAKQRLREKRAKTRKTNYEEKILEKSPELIQAEIEEYKEMEKAGKLTKWKKDKMSREIAFYDRLKDKVEERHEKRLEKQRGDSLHVNFDELKIHRKSSIYYDPVKNPYGAPPAGQVLMYRHPDGSIKKEPPQLSSGVSTNIALGLVPGHGDMVVPGQSAGSQPAPGEIPGDDENSDEEEDGSDYDPFAEDKSDDMEEEDEEDDDDDDDEPMLPGELPDGSKLPPGPPPGPAPSRAPLPPGPPPGPGLPPLPPGPPPGPGLPPLPPGAPPGGQPKMPFLPGKSGPPQMPQLPNFAAAKSQAEFAAQMQVMGFAGPPGAPRPGQVPGLPPGPPPKGAGKGAGYPQASQMKQAPPPPPKKAGAGLNQQIGGSSSSKPASPATVDQPPPGAKPPPPPPKKPAAAAPASALASAGPAKAGRAAATMFMPTTLRTKKPSQVAGGVLQASAASLSQSARNKVLFTEAPRTSAPVDMENAFKDFMEGLEGDD